MYLHNCWDIKQQRSKIKEYLSVKTSRLVLHSKHYEWVISCETVINWYSLSLAPGAAGPSRARGGVTELAEWSSRPTPTALYYINENIRDRESDRVRLERRSGHGHRQARAARARTLGESRRRYIHSGISGKISVRAPLTCYTHSDCTHTYRYLIFALSLPPLSSFLNIATLIYCMYTTEIAITSSWACCGGDSECDSHREVACRAEGACFTSVIHASHSASCEG